MNLASLFPGQQPPFISAAGLGTDAAGNVYTVANGQLFRFAPDATPTKITSVAACAVDASGNVGFIDASNPTSAIREVTTQAGVTTLAGATPQRAPDGTPLSDVWFLEPSWIAFDHNGNLYVAESQACLIREINTAGILSTFAGTGTCGYPAPSRNAKTADLVYPYSIAIDSQNNIWVTDEYLNFYSIAQDGPISFYPTRAPVSGGKGQLAIDSKDRVYVMGNFSLYRVLSDGTLQGNLAPPFPSLFGIGTDPSGNVYFTNNQTIYSVNDDGSSTKVYADQGNAGISGPFAVNAAGVAWSGNAFTGGREVHTWARGPATRVIADPRNKHVSAVAECLRLTATYTSSTATAFAS